MRYYVPLLVVMLLFGSCRATSTPARADGVSIERIATFDSVSGGTCQLLRYSEIGAQRFIVQCANGVSIAD